MSTPAPFPKSDPTLSLQERRQKEMLWYCVDQRDNGYVTGALVGGAVSYMLHKKLMSSPGYASSFPVKVAVLGGLTFASSWMAAQFMQKRCAEKMKNTPFLPVPAQKQ